MNFYPLLLLFCTVWPVGSTIRKRGTMQPIQNYYSFYNGKWGQYYYPQYYFPAYNNYGTPAAWTSPTPSFPAVQQNHLNWKGGYTAPKVFPAWNYNNAPALQKDEIYFNQCYLQYGQLGTCVDVNLCPSFLYYTAPYQFSERFAQCRYRNGGQKICCPANLVILKNNADTAIVDKQLETPSSAKPNPHENIIPKSDSNSTIKDESHIHIKNETASDQINKDNANYNSTSILASKEINETDPPVVLNPSNRNDFNFSSPDANQVCGLYDSSLDTWPWLVSIGNMDNITRKIEWLCLGSLITREYVLTTAHCLERTSLVVQIGKISYGSQTNTEASNSETISVAERIQYPKYNRTTLYQNIGLELAIVWRGVRKYDCEFVSTKSIRLMVPIIVRMDVIPLCFPFNAGVLDIIQFAGTRAQTTGYRMPFLTEKTMPTIQFAYDGYKILNHTVCSKIFRNPSNISPRFPNGIYPDIMCGLTRKHNPLCLISGAPLVLYDEPSNSFVVIGVSIGDPTCNEFSRQIVTFSRVNSFSSWIREQIGVLPHPPDCYF